MDMAMAFRWIGLNQMQATFYGDYSRAKRSVSAQAIRRFSGQSWRSPFQPLSSPRKAIRLAMASSRLMLTHELSWLGKVVDGQLFSKLFSEQPIAEFKLCKHVENVSVYFFLKIRILLLSDCKNNATL
jgi:hypothetical protein